jgi:hypothetical protein
MFAGSSADCTVDVAQLPRKIALAWATSDDAGAWLPPAPLMFMLDAAIPLLPLMDGAWLPPVPVLPVFVLGAAMPPEPLFVFFIGAESSSPDDALLHAVIVANNSAGTVVRLRGVMV